MKKCTWCGKAYQDEATVCVIDGHSLAVANLSPLSSQGEITAIQRRNPVIRAAIVSGAIFLIGVYRIVALAEGRWSGTVVVMLASVLLACVVAIGAVAFLARRTRTQWSWLRVIAVTFLGYVGFGMFCGILGFVLALISKGFHR